MAGIQDENVVDLVARDPDSGPILLVMTEDREWNTDPAQGDQLMRKISSYAAYILDGGLGNDYPETLDQPIRIELVCVQAPDTEADTIIEFGRARLAEFGIAFDVRVRPLVNSD